MASHSQTVAVQPTSGANPSMTNPTTANNPYASASLYVGDLAQEVTEATLFELFNAVGPVASIRVCRDASSRRSLGYAYVNFHSVQDAERALDTMNFTNIRGRQCRIMWSQRDPTLRKSGRGNIFVKNLHPSINNKTLYDTFSVFGNILSCKVMTDRDGKSLGYGYVHYANKEAGAKAIEGVNGMSISDKIVVAELFKPRHERLKGMHTHFTNIYVKYIPTDWTEEQLVELFEKQTGGEIDHHVFWVREYGVSACLNFKTPEKAQLAVETMNEFVAVPGPPEQKLHVARAMKRAERDYMLRQQRRGTRAGGRGRPFHGGVNLYVKNLPENCDDAKLKELFDQFGKITSAKVMRDGAGRSRGFGFVCFAEKQDATRAMTEMNSKIIDNKPLYVSRAQRKAARQAWLSRQRSRFQQQMMFYPGMGHFPGQQGMGQFAGPQQFYGQQQQQFRGGQYARTMGYPQAQMFPTLPTAVAPQHMVNPQFRQGFNAMQQFQQMRPTQMYPATQQSVTAASVTAAVPSTPLTHHRPPAASGQASSVGAGGQASQPHGDTGSQPQGQQMSAPMVEQQPLNAQMLNSVAPNERKRLIGERLFPKIQSVEPRLAGKITGMLLEMDNTELLHLLDNQGALMSKINEALQVLKEHQLTSQQNSAQQQQVAQA